MYRTGGEGGDDGVLVASPSDLVSFLSCVHKTSLDLRVAAGELDAPVEDDPDTAVLQRRGLEHEAAYLTSLVERGAEVVEVPDDPLVGSDADPGDGGRSLDRLRARVELTNAAIASGADVVFQATFLDDSDPAVWWRGHADFLTRTTDAHPDTGRPAYEPEDTKLAKHVKPGAVVQLSTYGELLGAVQGVEPEHLHVVLGGRDVETVASRDVGSYVRLARERFEATVADPSATCPEPVAHCGSCRWRTVCDDQRRADDHLSLVAGLGREQQRKLVAAGITTMAQLAEVAERERASWPNVPRLSDTTYERLVAQARLQVVRGGALDEPPPTEILEPSGPDRGLEALPPPSPHDLYFDMEGDPFVGDGGLEYLFGIGWFEGDEWTFRGFWGHTPAEEKAALEGLVDLVVERRAQHPDLHVYHYAPYEPAALGRLMGRYGTREDEIDDLLRDKVLVDLYRVVRQGVRVGAESYSIKKLEPLYMDARDGDITDAATSIVEYERWLEEGDQAILDAIERYNEDDCLSTALLHRWLEEQRTRAETELGVALERPAPAVRLGAASDDASGDAAPSWLKWESHPRVAGRRCLANASAAPRSDVGTQSNAR